MELARMTRSTDIPASGLEAYKWAKEVRERLEGDWHDSDDVMLMRLAVLADREMAKVSEVCAECGGDETVEMTDGI